MPVAPTLTIITQLGRQPHQWRRLAWLLVVVWLLLVGYQLLIVLAGRQVPATEIEPATLPSAKGPAPNQVASVDIETLVGWHLFGEANATQPEVAESQTLAIEATATDDTSLELTLEGVVAADREALARAVIRYQSTVDQYRVGDTLPVSSQVTLARVLPNRVILNNRGRLESLWLYPPQNKDKTTGLRAVPEARAEGQAPDTEETTPTSLAEILRVSVARDGDQLLGYQLAPGPDPVRFERLGLRAGDMLVRINDTPLNDPRRALELYNLLRQSHQARFTLQRDQVQLTLEVNLEDAG